jgi:uncharacterized membrane protein
MSVAVATRTALHPRAVELPAPPRVSASIAVLLGVVAGLFPSLIPHGPILRGVSVGLFVMAATALTRRLRPAAPRLRPPARRLTLAATAVVLPAFAWWAIGVEAAQRAAAGMPPAGPVHWAAAACVAVATGMLLRGIGWLARHRRRTWRPVLGAAVAVAFLAPAVPVQAVGSSGQVLQQDSPVGAVRAYAAERADESLGQRAQRAADLLVSRGGLAKEHVVVAVPTGSGWVDPAAVTGFEERFRGDVATVSLQYATTPSWVAFLFQRDSANTGARALLDAVLARVDTLPEAERPQVHLYGESLGALAGQAAVSAPGRADRLCSALWVGSPGGGRAGVDREVLVSNADDPVVLATPWLAVRPAEADAPWLPGLSYAQAAFDFVGSLAVPEGHGHRYGTDQALAMPTCPKPR